MKTVDIYEVHYKVNVNTKKCKLKNLEQTAFLVGNQFVEDRIMKQWNQDNVKLVVDSVSVKPYMKNVYFDDKSIMGYAQLFKVTSKNGQKKYFSILSKSLGHVHKYIDDNKMLENLDPFTDPYYVSYENSKITL